MINDHVLSGGGCGLINGTEIPWVEACVLEASCYGRSCIEAR